MEAFAAPGMEGTMLWGSSPPSRGQRRAAGDSNGDSRARVLCEPSTRSGMPCPEPTSASLCLLASLEPAVTLCCRVTLVGTKGLLLEVRGGFKRHLPGQSSKQSQKSSLVGNKRCSGEDQSSPARCPTGCTVQSRNHCPGTVEVE